MTVQRYTLTTLSGDMAPRVDGSWVRWKDHEDEVDHLKKRSQRREGVLAQMEDIKAALKQLQKGLESIGTAVGLPHLDLD